MIPELCCGSISQINPLLCNLLWSWCFIRAMITITRTQPKRERYVVGSKTRRTETSKPFVTRCRYRICSFFCWVLVLLWFRISALCSDSSLLELKCMCCDIIWWKYIVSVMFSHAVTYKGMSGIPEDFELLVLRMKDYGDFEVGLNAFWGYDMPWSCCSQGMKYGFLNEIFPIILRQLNTWSPVSGTLWEGFGSAAF